jgi:hypothetical protein
MTSLLPPVLRISEVPLSKTFTLVMRVFAGIAAAVLYGLYIRGGRRMLLRSKSFTATINLYSDDDEVSE